eukprot:29281-Pelagococcus_subviridis.AAC.9
MDQRRAVLLVLLLAHPHLLKRPERREDAPADPRRELPLRVVSARRHLHPHVRRRGVVKLRLQPLPQRPEQRPAAGEDHAPEQVLANVHVALVDRLEDERGKALRGGAVRVGQIWRVLPQPERRDQVRLEEELRDLEPLDADIDDVPVRQLVRHRGNVLVVLLRERLVGQPEHRLLQIRGDLALLKQPIPSARLRTLHVRYRERLAVPLGRALKLVPRPHRRLLALLEVLEHDVRDGIAAQRRSRGGARQRVPAGWS